MESQVQDVSCSAMNCLNNGFKPVVNFQNSLTNGIEYDVYAAFNRLGYLYIGRTNYLNRLGFIRLDPDEAIRNYGTMSFTSNVWEVSAFDQLSLSSQDIADGLTFFVGVVPQGSDNIERDVLGAAFRLTE